MSDAEENAVLALQGMRVLDLTTLLPGSLCTQILADLGAEVLKIEKPNGGDNFRSTPPVIKTMGSFFHILNRNKKGVALNFKHEEGREIFLKLVPRADVIVESCAPGTMEEIGLGYDDVKHINPHIIYCSLTGFGQDGPYREKPAHDIDFLSISGILDLLKERECRPMVPAVQLAGAGGSITAAMGILSALLRRVRTGEGQYLDVALLDCLTPFLSLVMSQYMADRTIPRQGVSRVGGDYACYNVYETADGNYLSLGCLEEKFWAEFCKAVGKEELIQEQYVSSPRREEIIEEVRSIFRQKTREEWIDYLDRYSICVSPVNSLKDVLRDPQITKRGLWFSSIHPDEGETPQQAFPIKFSEDQPTVRHHAPRLGEHTREVLRDLCYHDDEIKDLVDKGIV